MTKKNLQQSNSQELRLEVSQVTKKNLQKSKNLQQSNYNQELRLEVSQVTKKNLQKSNYNQELRQALRQLILSNSNNHLPQNLLSHILFRRASKYLLKLLNFMDVLFTLMKKPNLNQVRPFI